MLRNSVRLVFAGLVWTMAVTPLIAHHEISAKFDPARPTTLSGQVTKVDWANPHVHVLMNVRSGGRIVNWAVEIESQLDLERSGWNMDSLKPGDSVSVQGILARDGSPQVWGNSIVLTSTKKKVLAVSPEALRASMVRNSGVGSVGGMVFRTGTALRASPVRMYAVASNKPTRGLDESACHARANGSTDAE